MDVSRYIIGRVFSLIVLDKYFLNYITNENQNISKSKIGQ